MLVERLVERVRGLAYRCYAATWFVAAALGLVGLVGHVGLVPHMWGVVQVLFWLWVAAYGVAWLVGRVGRRRSDAGRGETGRADGDPVLAARLDRFAASGTRALACVMVDLNQGRHEARSAFVDCDASTVFEIGSITKALNGLVIADAVDRGEMSLDAPLADLVPLWTRVPLGRRTMLDLCTHDAGLPRLPVTPRMYGRALLTTWFPGDPYAGYGVDDVLRDAGRARPRRRSGYSNLGGAAAGHVAARAAGLDYEALLQQRLLAPLGMTRTTSRPSAPTPHGWSRDGRREPPWSAEGYAPAGDVVSTPHDLGLLMVALLDGTAPGGWAMREQRHGTGLFWQVQHGEGGRTRAWHNGQTGGYSAYLEIFPEARRARLLLANVADADALARLSRHLRFDDLAQERDRLGR